MIRHEEEGKLKLQFILTGDPAQWVLNGAVGLTSPFFSPSTVTTLWDRRSVLCAFHLLWEALPKFPDLPGLTGFTLLWDLPGAGKDTHANRTQSWESLTKRPSGSFTTVSFCHLQFSGIAADNNLLFYSEPILYSTNSYCFTPVYRVLKACEYQHE